MKEKKLFLVENEPAKHTVQGNDFIFNVLQAEQTYGKT